MGAPIRRPETNKPEQAPIPLFMHTLFSSPNIHLFSRLAAVEDIGMFG